MYPHEKLPALLDMEALATDSEGMEVESESPTTTTATTEPPTDALAVPGTAVTADDLALAVGHYADGDAAPTAKPAAAPNPFAYGYFKQPTPPKRRVKYRSGTHGAKTAEQKRLTAAYGQKVSGATHESEHPVGDAVLRQSTGLLRTGKGRAGELEKKAAAYQESHPMHRDHIGTGSSSEADESGMDSQKYRDTQRALLESGDVSSAIQINQLGYAVKPAFQQETGFPAEAANDSYNNMVVNMTELTHGSGDNDVSQPVSQMQQVEMLVAREVARSGKWPKRENLKRAWEQLGYVEPDYDSDDDTTKEPPLKKQKT